MEGCSDTTDTYEIMCIYFPQALVDDIQTVQPSLNGINEVGQALKKEAEPLFAVKIQKMLDDLNSQWELICKQVITTSYSRSADRFLCFR